MPGAAKGSAKGWGTLVYYYLLVFVGITRIGSVDAYCNLADPDPKTGTSIAFTFPTQRELAAEEPALSPGESCLFSK